MQRPLLVLLIVIVGLAALLFGVLGFLSPDNGPADGVTKDPVIEEPTPAPSPGTPLTGGEGSTTRTSTGASASGELVASEPTENVPWDNALSGVVLGKGDQPVPDCEVQLTAAETETMMFISNDPVDHSKDQFVRTKRDGTFAFHNIEPRDRYKLIFKHPEYMRHAVDSVPVGAQGLFEEMPVHLPVGASLRGYVRDETNNPIAGARLVLDGAKYGASPYDPPDRLTAVSNAEGLYVISHIEPGPRILTVTAEGFGTVGVPNLNFRADEQQPQVRDIVLRVGHLICGRVLVAGGGGLADATVLAIGASNQLQTHRAEAVTDAQGEFCVRDLAPGRYTVYAQARGWQFDKPKQFDSNASNVILEARRQPSVCGQVLDPQGRPVPEFELRLRIYYPSSLSQPIPESRETFSDKEGRFCIAGVVPNEHGYEIEARAEGFAPTFSEVFRTTAGADVQGVTVRLNQGGALRGRIVDAEGRPVPRARVQTHDNEWTDDEFTRLLGEEYATRATATDVRADEQGRFLIRGLNPETYQIVVDAGGFMQHWQMHIQVAGSGVTDVGDVTLMRGGAVEGTLFDASGRPLAGGRVSAAILEGDRPVNLASKTDGQGRYRISNMRPGRWRLMGSSVGHDAANPFQNLNEARQSERQVIVTEGTVTRQDVIINQ